MIRHLAMDDLRRSWPLWLTLTLAVGVSAVTPILTLDTDLWYHLRHGRTILETGELPSDTSFSFLRPVRPFVDYYWLFQVICQTVFQQSGFGGLIVLRSLCVGAMLLACALVLRRSDGDALWQAVALGLVAATSLGRMLGFRPHDFTYAFLAVFLAALARRRTPVWLPLVALAWVNVHGVTYPLLLVVVGAFGLDLAREIVGGGRSWGASRRRAGILGASALATLATPHGLALLPTPFRFDGEAGRIIRELAPPQPAALWQWHLDWLHPDAGWTLALVWLIPWLLWRAHRSGGIRPSRWALLAAGLYLASRAGRFHVELVLFCLPLVADALRPVGSAEEPRRLARLRIRPLAGTAWLGICGALVSLAVAGWRLPHPLGDRGELPRGVATFLAAYGEGGRILHRPSFGGYLLGRLDGRFEIALDLELPFAFTSEDYDLVTHAFHDDRVLASFLRRFEPEFVAEGRQRGFGDRLRAVAPEYQPVFVDDAVTLWASARSRPELVKRWGLKAVDAERLLQDPGYLPARRAAAVEELSRIVAVAPLTRSAGRALVRLHLAEQNLDEALSRAESLAAIAGPQPLDLQLIGDARAVSGDVAGAVEALETALRLDESEDAGPLHRRLAYLHLQQGRLDDAYDHLRRVVGLHRPGSPEPDVRLLARLAREAGDDEHAEALLRSLAWRRSIGESLESEEPAQE